jgi:CRISPR-associated protein Cst1
MHEINKMLMKQDSPITDFYTCVTGDAFADTGGLVIQFLQHLPQFKGKNIMHLINFVADVYIDNWQAKLHPFFLNSTITQAQFVGERKRQETLDYFNSLIDEEVYNHIGYCEISGRKTKLFPAGRNNQILGGSGTYVNFHFSGQPGVYLSKETIIRMFFVPFGVHRLADKMSLLISNNEKVSQFFVFQNCLANMAAIKDNTSEGPLKSVFRNPASALFKFIDGYQYHLNRSLNTEEKNDFDAGQTNLSLYHFSNLGQKPEIAVYTMDNVVFSFYHFCNTAFYQVWQKFIIANYSPDNYKKSIFNEQTNQWETKEGEEITFEEYAKWKNFVLNNLLHGGSLVKIFLKWSRYNYLPFEIIKTYQIVIRQMKHKTLEKIEILSEFIAKQGEDATEEHIDCLNNVMSRIELRKFFLSIQSLAYTQNSKAALISAEDYVEYLLPKGVFWSELRDLLVIAIYQKRNEKTI